MIITIIGSRETPPEELKELEAIAKEARERLWWVRSGHAEGADYAAELGAKERCIVYMPWASFNLSGKLVLPMLGIPRVQPLRDEVLKIVYKHEPYAKELSDGIKRIKSRNVYQVLGEDLKTPSNAVICWTPNGETVGGTGLAIKIAESKKVPVINLGDPNTASHLDEIMSAIQV